MTKTVEQTRRELFEVWLLKHKPIVAADMLEEGSFVPEWMFESWCAALESVFIELPILIEPEPPEDAFDDSWRDGYAAADRYRNKCRAAIEQAGLGIKCT